MTRLTNATSAITGFLFSVVLMTSCSTAKDEKTASAEETAQTVAETKVDDNAITPSFDCAKAKTEVEKLICSDPELARLDKEMANSYVAFMETLDEDFYRKKLVRKQHDWLGYRGKLSCFNTNNKKKTDCLKKSYVRRIENLSNWKERNNYDFFIDIYDHYEKKEYIGFENYLEKPIAKFVSGLGEEYYIDCSHKTIFPKFPEEKVYFDNFPSLKDGTSSIYIKHQEEDFFYLQCNALSDMLADRFEEFSPEFLNGKYTELNLYPAKPNFPNLDKLHEIYVYPYKNSEEKGKCETILKEMQEYGITPITPIVVNSFKELKDKIGISCSYEKFSKNFSYKSNVENIPPYIFYRLSNFDNIITAKDASKLDKVCLFDERKCDCVFMDFSFRTNGSIINLNNKYYFIDSSYKDSSLKRIYIKKIENKRGKTNKTDEYKKSCIYNY